MFLNKRTMRPVGLGSFCVVSDDLKKEMKQSKNYLSNNGQQWNSKFIHLADADVLYVIDTNVFDKEELCRVLPLSFDGDGYWAEKALLSAQKKKSFTVSKCRLTLLVSGWKERESVVAYQQGRLRQVLGTSNTNYDLDKKNIPLQWEDS
jgi:hypothetical protein